MKVKPERTGWRDQALSARHREWGWDCPAVDIDQVWIEYDMGKVMGLFEYKREAIDWPPDLSARNYVALRDMADKARVPLFVVRYGRNLSWFEPRCASNIAHLGWAAYHGGHLTELEYVTFLYKLRTRHIPDGLAAKLSQP